MSALIIIILLSIAFVFSEYPPLWLFMALFCVERHIHIPSHIPIYIPSHIYMHIHISIYIPSHIHIPRKPLLSQAGTLLVSLILQSLFSVQLFTT